MPQTIQELIGEANKLIAKKKYHQALGVYAEICKARPKDHKAWIKVGDLLRLVDDKKQALAVYAKAARGLAEDGFLLQAIAVNKQILEIDPKHNDTQKRLAGLYAARVQEIKDEKQETQVLLEDLKKQQPPRNLGAETNDVVLKEFKGFDSDEPAITSHRFDLGEAEPSKESESQVRDRLEKLPETPLFSSLSPEQFAAVIPALKLIEIDEGRTVMREGESGDSLFIIADGTAKVVKLGADRREVQLGEMQAGTFFGEMALFEGGHRTATVVAVTPLKLLEIDRAALNQLTTQYPAIQATMQTFYLRRLLRTVLKMSPAFRDLPEAHLQSLCARFRLADLPAGKRILESGAKVNGLLLVENGAVGILGGSKVFEKGGFPALRAFLSGQPTEAAYATTMPTRLYQLPGDLYATLVQHYPKIDAELRKLVA